jgi:hypothetical protein
MSPFSPRLPRALAAAVCGLLAVASAAAQAEDLGASVDVFGSHSVVQATATGVTFHEESLGVRAAYRLTGGWALEAALSRSNGDSTVWNGDVSAKVYLFQTDLGGLYLVVGPGVRREELFEGTGDSATVHAGLGTEIALGPRAYLRPEVLGRWATSDVNQRKHSVDYSLGLGWRF